METLFISEPIVNRLGWVLVHSIWQFAVLAVLAAVVVRTMRDRSATSRYAALLFAMIGMVAAPAVTFSVLSGENRAVSQAEGVPELTSEPAEPFFDELGNSNFKPGATVAELAQSNSSGPVGDPESRVIQESTAGWGYVVARFVRPWLPAMVFAWCVGALLFSCRPLLSWLMVRRLRYVGTTAVSQNVRDLLNQTAERMRLPQVVGVLQSTIANGPMVIGWFRPVVLLPTSLISGLPVSQLESILAHELAHVRRHDYVVNLVQTFVETAFFYHPAVWWLSSQIRNERENCCDDLAVGVLGNRVEYGRALLAVAEMQGPNAGLALGANGGSLLTRVRRVVGMSPPKNRPRPPALAAILNLVFVGAVGVFLMTLNVANAGSVVIDEQFGPESHGLRCRLIAVVPDSDDESPGLAKPTGEFSSGDQLTFAVELKNVSGQPITLLGVRYGKSFGASSGKLNAPFYAPHLFEFDFVDSTGRPIPRSQRTFERQAIVIGGTSVSAHTVAPGESLIVLLRPARFRAPMQYELPSGDFRATVRYRGPNKEIVTQTKLRHPDIPQANAWQHQVESNSVKFSIAAVPGDEKAQELVWGPVKDGLQGAIEFRVPDDVQGVPGEEPGVPVGTALEVVFHVKNVGDNPITFVSESARQGDRIHVVDVDGDPVEIRDTFSTGWPIDVRWKLNPGDVARLNVLAANLESIEKSGQYNVRYTIRFNSRQAKDGEGNITFPLPGDWQDVLETGTTPLFLYAPEVKSGVGKKVEGVNGEKQPDMDGGMEVRGRLLYPDGSPAKGMVGVASARVTDSEWMKRLEIEPGVIGGH